MSVSSSVNSHLTENTRVKTTKKSTIVIARTMRTFLSWWDRMLTSPSTRRWLSRPLKLLERVQIRGSKEILLMLQRLVSSKLRTSLEKWRQSISCAITSPNKITSYQFHFLVIPVPLTRHTSSTFSFTMKKKHNMKWLNRSARCNTYLKSRSNFEINLSKHFLFLKFNNIKYSFSKSFIPVELLLISF